MKSTLDTLDGLSRKLSIQVPAEDVRTAFDKVYRGIQRNATIKGFRPGKAPMTTIRSLYRDRVEQDVIQDLVSDSYQKALEEHQLEPIGFPKVDLAPFSEESDFSYTAELEIRPEIQIKKVEGLKVEKEKYEITNESIESLLKNLQERQAEEVTVFEDRGAQTGDVVIVDFKGFIDGAPMEQGEAQDYPLELGSGRSIPGFEDGIIGMKVGDSRDISVKFPDDYHAADVAGKPAQFQMKLKQLKTKRFPEINEEFAKKNGKANMDELRAEIKADLVAGEERRIQEDVKNKVMRAFVDANPVAVPASLLQQQIETLQKDVQDRMKQEGQYSEAEFEDYKTKWSNDFTDSAKFMVQCTFLVDALADQKNLRATSEEFEARITQHAESTGIERARIAEFYQKKEMASRLNFQLTEEKVANFLIEKASIS